MQVSVSCETDKFNLSVVGEDFINDCCFGEDFSEWLVAALTKQGIEADLLCMEDYGWSNVATDGDSSYLLSVSGLSADDKDRPNFGEWIVTMERHRSFMDKLLGRNKITPKDRICLKVTALLREAGYGNVRTVVA
jgi:hypothetical protein